MRLASGSRDTDIIVWDLVGERGLFKLRGHKDQITGLSFVAPRRFAGDDAQEGRLEDETGQMYILSTSKDALIKMWDVESQYCMETHVTQSNGECWGLGVSPDEGGCITAGNDGELRVWTLEAAVLRDLAANATTTKDASFLHSRGTLYTQGRTRTTGISFHLKSDYIAVHGSEKAVELWRIRSPAEIQKHLARKRRRRKEKAAAAGTQDTDGDATMAQGEIDPSNADVSEVFTLHVIVRTGGKVRSIDWAGGRPNKSLQILVATTNNQLELYHITSKDPGKKSSKSDEPPDYNRTQSVELPGHRTEVRAVSLSSDDRMLVTASNGALKIWNTRTQSCLRTLECGYTLCCAFLPGDRVVVLGNNKGELELFDIAASATLDTVPAHDAAIWSVRVHPDGKSLASGSADKSVKFWDLRVVPEEIPGTKRTAPRLRLHHARTLKLVDDILSLAFTPDSRLLAISTLDNMARTFFTDTLKLYQTLYGHKLPILHMSISADSTLLATCSADKNIKIWGLDHGDCHKSLFAHDDSIMAVAFIPDPPSPQDAHLLFSCAKDGLLRTWDADKFVPVQRLRGHHADVLAMAVSRAGDFAVTASRDRSMRVWALADEPLFLEEERDRELEELHDAHLAESLDRDARDEDALAEQNLGADPAENGAFGTVAPASKQTGTTLTASERITEALSLCTADLDAAQAHAEAKAANPGAVVAALQRHPVLALRNVAPEVHLLGVFEAIPSPALQDALLLLPFSVLPALFRFLGLWVERRMNVALTCRVLFFLLRTHHRQVVASRELRGVLGEMKGALRTCLEEWKGVLGYNAAACRVLGERVGEARVRRLEDAEGVGEIDRFGDGEGEKGRKRAFITVG